ncbi:Trp biosynthesis-associated membrane protein [Nocardioides ultimimeridianus]
MADAGRRTFGPVVLVGLVGAALTAVGGHKTMLEVQGSYLRTLEGVNPAAALQARDGVDFPLAGALALVVLAAWGVLLVTRGGFRRVVGGLTVVAAAGVLVVLVVGGFVQRGSAASDMSDRLGVTDAVPLDATTWFWTTLLGAVLTLAAAVAAVRFAPSWPEMGSRYDAPTAGADTGSAPTAPAEEQTNIELWKSLDEGHDPTA